MNVIQVRRVVNPKGVWRSMADNNPFRVRMMVRRADIAGSQFTLCELWRNPRKLIHGPFIGTYPW